MCKYIEYIHKTRITGSMVICIYNFDKSCQLVLHKGHRIHTPLRNEKCLLPKSLAKGLSRQSTFSYSSLWHPLTPQTVGQKVYTQL